MARHKKVEIGQTVQLRHTFGGRDERLPFVVTHVYDDDTVSGVAFSGEPGALGWGNRPTQGFPMVKQGDAHREWRSANGRRKEAEALPEPLPESESSPEPVKDGS